MAKKTILTRLQRDFLELILKEPYFLKNYYWTGGTVLSEFYYHHRDSHDIDLFTEEQEVKVNRINDFIGIAGAKIRAKKIRYTRFLGLHSYTLDFPKGQELKVDFNYYPFARIDKRKKWNGLSYDSLLDIAVNKIHTVATRPRGRDYIDLFFILREKDPDFSIANLIKLAKIKFDWHIEAIQLGENFAKVLVKQTDKPHMLVPFDWKEMEEYFLDLAKKLKSEIFR